jgi:hypothetical protein
MPLQPGPGACWDSARIAERVGRRYKLRFCFICLSKTFSGVLVETAFNMRAQKYKIAHSRWKGGSMQIERARSIPEAQREEMTAEALALAFDAGANLGTRAVIDAIGATMSSIGNPLEKIWLEDATGRRSTYTVEQASALLGNEAGYRYLWAIPQSERRNHKSRWLTVATVDNTTVNKATMFFALPRGVTQEFAPHVTLLKHLARADIVPRYGFGYAREYGCPDYFAVDYACTHGKKALDRSEWVRRAASINARADGPVAFPDPPRQVRSLLLDVFPLNILTDAHLQQRLGDESLKEWIMEETGPASLMEIEPRCFAWFVPPARTFSLATQLRRLGQPMVASPQRAH